MKILSKAKRTNRNGKDGGMARKKLEEKSGEKNREDGGNTRVG